MERKVKIDLAFKGSDMAPRKKVSEQNTIVPGLKWENREDSNAAVHLGGWASVCATTA